MRSWKRLSAAQISLDFKLSSGQAYAFVNGAVHWISQLYRYFKKDNLIVWFEMASEAFGQILLPEALRRHCCRISRYRESLALIGWESVGEYRSSYGLEVWIMAEYGVTESWTKLFNIHPHGLDEYEPLAWVYIRRNGEILLNRENKRGLIMSVDIMSRQVEEFGMYDRKYYFLDSFVESMVLLDQSDTVAY